MKNIDVTAFIMGIAHPNRMEWLKNTISYMDNQNFPFKKKIVSIDQFNGHSVLDSDVKFLEEKGWVVLLDSHKSRILSMDRAFNLIDTDYIFYNEDDVMADMPKIEDLSSVFNTRIGGVS